MPTNTQDQPSSFADKLQNPIDLSSSFEGSSSDPIDTNPILEDLPSSFADSLPKIIILNDGQPVRVTRCDATDIVFDRLEENGFDIDDNPIYKIIVPAQAVVPIVGFNSESWPTDEDLANAIVAPQPTPQPTQAEIYFAQQAQGYLDSETGLLLKTTEAAQSSFVRLLTLLREAESLGALPPTAIIWDATNSPHELSVIDLRALMVRYGLYCAQLFAEFAP